MRVTSATLFPTIGRLRLGDAVDFRRILAGERRWQSSIELVAISVRCRGCNGPGGVHGPREKLYLLVPSRRLFFGRLLTSFSAKRSPTPGCRGTSANAMQQRPRIRNKKREDRPPSRHVGPGERRGNVIADEIRMALWRRRFFVQQAAVLERTNDGNPAPPPGGQARQRDGAASKRQNSRS